MKSIARKLHVLQLLIVMNASAESIDELLMKFNDQARSNRFGESNAEMVENHRIIKRWEELQALTSFVNADPITAAEFALAGSAERFPVALAAAEAEPLQFVRFWNRISQESSLMEEQVQFVYLGLDIRDGANLYTLAFHHDVPLIAELLGRLSDLVKHDEFVFERVEIIGSGRMKEAHLEYFREYVRGDGWKSLIPDLRGLVATDDGDISAGSTALVRRPEENRSESYRADEPSGGTPSRWVLFLGGVAVLGILLLLIWVFLRERAS